jgi:hypothetical protein
VSPNGVGSASDLVRQEVAQLIADAKYPDLEILWHIPEIVRHERQYQMQAEALKLRFPISKIERLLGHNLALTDSALLDHVRTKIDEAEQQLGLQEIKLDHSLIDWPKLIHAAVYRRAPFEPGEKEKGFRDAIVAESFIQLVESSPRTPSICRVVLVTSDRLLMQAVKERIKEEPNGSVVSSLEELKGLINTIVSNVGEDFIAQLKPKASKLFFISSDDKGTLFYKEKLTERVEEQFKAELKVRPEVTSFRDNNAWHIHQPNFLRKDGRRIFWTTRIDIEVEVGTLALGSEPKASSVYESNLGAFTILDRNSLITQKSPYYNTLAFLNEPVTYGQNVFQTPGAITEGVVGRPLVFPQKKVVSHKGRDIYEVLWSTEITMSKDLKKPTLEEISHIEFNLAPI